ncbi:MAG: UvrD-helicase domain-containing protein [Oscillospiraceae bacterium]|nr:UvrD-helicase domain-containing protein [Oscillospiraceae bacterium]
MERSKFEKRFIAARKAAIARGFPHLNEAQLAAVLATQGPLLLLAGAGSGKTTVLINRIANIIKYGGGSDSDYVPDYATEEELAFLESIASRGRADRSHPGNAQANDSEPDAHLDNAPPRNAHQDSAPFEPPADGGASIDMTPEERLQDLCTVDPVEPWRIIAITFTNKAAGEMKKRLSDMLGPDADDIWAMTFHSACARMLRRDIDRLGYERSFTIYDSADTAALMKRILKDMDIDEKNLPHKTVLGYISRAKDEMITAENFLASANKTNDMRRKVIGSAYEEYENRLKSSNALDFDDLIMLTVRLFYENQDVLQHYQRRFKYILVDEYQDTNNLQYLLASALAGGYGNICVVGDDDQSIYKFRGATIENILNFEKHFKNARVMRLEQNYRSTGLILDAANDVIRHNKGRKGKTLWTEKEPGNMPELHIVDDERAEAQFVADSIISNASQGRKWSEHAILYRMNAQSNQLETAFKRVGVPYRVVGGTGFYERAEIKDMLAYLCVIHNPQDDVRLLRIINTPARGIGDTSIGRLSALAAELGCPIFDAIAVSQDYENLKSAAGRMHAFADMINDLREAMASSPLDELYDALINRTGYIRALEEKNSIENESRIENVRELKTNIIGFMKENENGGSLFDFLSETALYTDIDRGDVGTDRVNMMTMHSAKGLEFEVVFIVGAEEGVFPGTRAIGEAADMEEERRLCYVAMTRAMSKLCFTSARQRMLFGKTSASATSRFVREIGKDKIEVHEPFGRNRYYDSYESYDASDFPGSSGSSGYPDSPSSTDSPDFPRSGYGRTRPGDAAARVDLDESQGFYDEQQSTQIPATQRQSQKQGYEQHPPRQASEHHKPRQAAPNKKEKAPPKAAQATDGNAAGFAIGDVVTHTVFGRGIITDLARGGNDALLEIAFDGEGTKRFMLNSAAKYLQKT